MCEDAILVKTIVLVYANGEFMYRAIPQVLSNGPAASSVGDGFPMSSADASQETRGGTPTSGLGHFADQPCRRAVQENSGLRVNLVHGLEQARTASNAGRNYAWHQHLDAIRTGPVSFLVLKFLTCNYYY
jgi:hypothetical protein